MVARRPQAPGYPTPWWTGQRVRRLIKEQFGIAYHPGHVWKILVRPGGSPPRPVGRARQRNEDQIRRWKRQTWPTTKKKAHQQGRTIVFVDETWLLQTGLLKTPFKAPSPAANHSMLLWPVIL